MTELPQGWSLKYELEGPWINWVARHSGGAYIRSTAISLLSSEETFKNYSDRLKEETFQRILLAQKNLEQLND